MNKANSGPALELRDIRHSFPEGGQSNKKKARTAPGAGHRLEVLKGVNLTVRAGEIVALVGPSGSGKSTLLHIAGLLERPVGGQVLIDGRDCGTMSDRDWTLLRRQKIGFVFQAHHLLPEFTALENVAMPQRVALFGKARARDRAAALLGDLGLGARLDHQPMQLSGGEQQRVAIARALANRPKILLADEPTGNLDPKTSEAVFDNLIALVRKEGLAALIATHNTDLARRMDRTVQLVDGRVEEVDRATRMP